MASFDDIFYDIFYEPRYYLAIQLFEKLMKPENYAQLVYGRLILLVKIKKCGKLRVPNGPSVNPLIDMGKRTCYANRDMLHYFALQLYRYCLIATVFSMATSLVINSVTWYSF